MDNLADRGVVVQMDCAAVSGDTAVREMATVVLDVKVHAAVLLHLLLRLPVLLAIARVVIVAANGAIAVPLLISVALDVKVDHVKGVEIPQVLRHLLLLLHPAVVLFLP